MTVHGTLLLSGALALTACSSQMSKVGTQGPKAYVGLFGENAVAVVDTGSRKVIKTISVPTGPHGLVVTPDGRKVYVSSDGATTVSVISTSTDEVVDSIEVGSTPHGLTMTPDGRKVVLCGFGIDQAKVIDTATDEVVLDVPVPRPHNSAVSPDGLRAFVGSQQMDTPSIAVVDMASGAIASSVPLDHSPRALDYAPSQRVYFTVSGVDALQVLDPATFALGMPIPTGGSPHHMKATIDGEYELVVSQTLGDLEFVDPVSAKVIANVPTGSAPHWIGLSSDGHFAWVTNESSNSLSVVDIEAKRVVDTISVGKGPRKVAVQPGNALQ